MESLYVPAGDMFEYEVTGDYSSYPGGSARQLNNRGLIGWELIQVVPGKNGPTLYWKRKKVKSK